MPVLYELASKFGLAPSFKQYGEDMMIGYPLHAFPYQLASLFYPLVFKTFSRLSPPIQWKGGMLVNLFKNKGSSSLISNYRDIFLGDFTGKAAYRIVIERN
jgi:hypothetical protein